MAFVKPSPAVLQNFRRIIQEHDYSIDECHNRIGISRTAIRRLLNDELESENFQAWVYSRLLKFCELHGYCIDGIFDDIWKISAQHGNHFLQWFTRYYPHKVHCVIFESDCLWITDENGIYSYEFQTKKEDNSGLDYRDFLVEMEIHLRDKNLN